MEGVAQFDAVRPPHQRVGPPDHDDVARRTAAIMEAEAGLEEEGWAYCRSLVKSPRQILWQLRLEWALLRREWRWMLWLLLIEYVHLVSRNLVYYIQVSSAQSGNHAQRPHAC